MTYLLDVSALLGMTSREHEFHPPITAWVKTLHAGRDFLATCSITELGAVRILPQSSRGSVTVKEVQEILAEVKAASVVPFTFLSDNLGVDKLPVWVKLPKDTTDGHLAALAKAHGATLATFDNFIPEALVIPRL